MMESRLLRVREEMKNRKIDCLAITPSSDLEYLTGYRGMAMESPTIFLLTQRDAYLILPTFEEGNVSPESKRQVECVPWQETENAFTVAAGLMRQQGMYAAIADQAPSFIFHHLMKAFPTWSWEIAGPLTAALRSQKEPGEIENLRTANHPAGKALMRLFEEKLCGKTEIEAGEMLRAYCQAEGMKATSVGIVAAGENSALPHHTTGDRVIREGNVLLIDFGADYRGYQSDMTRTVAVRRIPDGFKEIYRIVLEANKRAFEAARPGVLCETLDSIARGVITEAGYGACFTHRLGHGIGMDVHEHPYITQGNKEPIRPGNVFSDEPGIYIPGRYGIRIEDILAVTETGAVRLTDTTRDILTID